MGFLCLEDVCNLRYQLCFLGALYILALFSVFAEVSDIKRRWKVTNFINPSAVHGISKRLELFHLWIISSSARAVSIFTMLFWTSSNNFEEIVQSSWLFNILLDIPSLFFWTSFLNVTFFWMEFILNPKSDKKR